MLETLTIDQIERFLIRSQMYAYLIGGRPSEAPPTMEMPLVLGTAPLEWPCSSHHSHTSNLGTPFSQWLKPNLTITRGKPLRRLLPSKPETPEHRSTSMKIQLRIHL